MKSCVPVIPAYCPDEKLSVLIDNLKTVFSRIVVVDDGSPRGVEIFERLRAVKGVEVLVHEKNRGKGAALKTAFRYLLEHGEGVVGVVTCDADGQHLPKDIVRVAEEVEKDDSRIVLGVRTLRADAPLRSRFGNAWARMTFRLLAGFPLSDTQTGLRGIPFSMLKRMASLNGERYEYEMYMLADCRHHAELPLQLPIETVYIDDNSSSHFRPFTDAILTQWALVRAVLFGI